MEQIQKKYIKDNIQTIIKEQGIINFEKNGSIACSQRTLDYIDRYKVGDFVEATIETNTNQISFLKKIDANSTQPEIKKVDKKAQGYVFLQGKWYATFEVLLKKLHEMHPKHRITTEMIEIDKEKKQAIFNCNIEILGENGETIIKYNAYGDADSTNLNSTMLASYIRMAETRSIVRAMRLATCIAETSTEELPTQ